jgi:hypothetical protein
MFLKQLKILITDERTHTGVRQFAVDDFPDLSGQTVYGQRTVCLNEDLNAGIKELTAEQRSFRSTQRLPPGDLSQGKTACDDLFNKRVH